MIESVLIFVTGALSAGIVALLLVPALNARAVRLAIARLERTLPRTLGEVAAAKDAVRAEMAARMARVEVDRDRLLRKLVDLEVSGQGDKDRFRLLEIERKALGDALADSEARLELVRTELRGNVERLAHAELSVRELERRLQEQSAPPPVEDRDKIDMKLALVEAEARIAALTEAMAELSSSQIETSRMVDSGVSSFTESSDPAADEQRIEALAKRLRNLKARNAARLRSEDKGSPAAGEEAP